MRARGDHLPTKPLIARQTWLKREGYRHDARLAEAYPAFRVLRRRSRDGGYLRRARARRSAWRVQENRGRSGEGGSEGHGAPGPPPLRHPLAAASFCKRGFKNLILGTVTGISLRATKGLAMERTAIRVECPTPPPYCRPSTPAGAKMARNVQARCIVRAWIVSG